MNIKTDNGRLTSYGLACGYIENKEIKPGIEITLWHEGGPNYHVRAHDFNTHTRLFWDTFTKLSRARNRFDTFKIER